MRTDPLHLSLLCRHPLTFLGLVRSAKKKCPVLRYTRITADTKLEGQHKATQRKVMQSYEAQQISKSNRVESSWYLHTRSSDCRYIKRWRIHATYLTLHTPIPVSLPTNPLHRTLSIPPIERASNATTHSRRKSPRTSQPPGRLRRAPASQPAIVTD